MFKTATRMTMTFTIGAILMIGCTPHATPVAYVPQEDSPDIAVTTSIEELAQSVDNTSGVIREVNITPTTETISEDTSVPLVTATTDRPSKPQFSTTSATKDLPPNIMEEIIYFGGMGGGGGLDCGDVTSDVVSAPYQDLPVKILAPFQYVVTCGWEEGESIRATMTSPVGRTETVLEEGGFDGGFYFVPKFMIDDPIGTYKLHVEGKSGALDTTFEVVKPAHPLTLIREGELILYGFVPNERVGVFAYDQSQGLLGRFSGWKMFNVDTDGKLAIELDASDPKETTYYVVSESSGDIDGLITCAKASPSRLKVGMQAQVVFGEGLSIASDLLEIGWSEIILPRGTVVEILDGPTCVDTGSFAWYVQTLDGQTGFVLENGREGYFLSPEIETSIFEQSFSCENAMLPRLEVGMHARVTVTNGLPLRVRRDPGYSQKIRQQIPEATEFDVIDGPVCAEKTVWWKIQTTDGVKGWVAEGQDGEFYIEPWQ